MEKLAKTISMHVMCEMEKINSRAASFDYNVNNNFDGPDIIITPADANVSFKDAYFVNDFSDYDSQHEFSRITCINLVANMELENTDDDSIEIGIDDIGQIILTPYAALEGTPGIGRFVDFYEEEEAQLQVEELEEESNEDISEEEIDVESVSAEVITEAANDEEEGPAWQITYDLPLDESLNEDAEESDADTVEIIHAPDAETAVKYAKQYARVKAKEDSRWQDAEVVGIQKRG